MQAWTVVDRVATGDGVLELRQRGPDELVIAAGDRVLMASRHAASEEALGRLVAGAITGVAAPRMLVAGLGMGITLRAALDRLPADARVVVAELHERVVRWCEGPLATTNGDALADPRVRVVVGDVADEIAAAADPGAPAERRFHAIALDLYGGVGPVLGSSEARFFDRPALRRVRAALGAGGVLGRWCEQVDVRFERELGAEGFTVTRRRAGGPGGQYVVYLGIRDEVSG